MEIQEGLIENKIITKKRKGIKCKDKTVAISRISMNGTEHIQYGLMKYLEHKETSLKKMYLTVFPEDAELPIEDNFECENEIFNIACYENSDKYIFCSIWNYKEFKDAMAKIFDRNSNKEIKNTDAILQYYTFVLIDKTTNLVAHIENRNITNILRLLEIYFYQKTKIAISIKPSESKDLTGKIDKAYTLGHFNFVLDNNFSNITANALDETLSWERELSSYKIEVSIKPTKKMIHKVLEHNDILKKTKKAKLPLIDENGESEIINLLNNRFSIKIKIPIDNLEMNNYEQIKKILINKLADI